VEIPITADFIVTDPDDIAKITDVQTSDATITQICDYLMGQGFKAVLVPPDTPLYCAECHDSEAPQYRLRRRGGKYVALCYRPGTTEGCWEQDATPMCDYKDHQGVQCTNVAEWGIGYGPDKVVTAHRCLLHVAPALSDVTEHRVFPL
jgi:hypothetical protein